MTAPEDQNGLREALARVLAPEKWKSFDAVQGWQDNTVKSVVMTWPDSSLRMADALIAGPLASLIADRTALRAAEAEITRLKEGMEAGVGALKALRPLSDVAAPGDWSVSGVRRRVDEASCIIIDAPSCPVLLALPTGNGAQTLEALRDAKLAVAAVNFVRAALATLSPKEHPHG